MDKALYERIWERKAAKPVESDVAGSRTDVAFGLLPGGASLLDVGCGDGFFLSRAKERYAHVAGVDFSEVALGGARRRGFEVSACDFSREPLPFADASFDAVTCLDTIEHVFDIRFMLAQIARVIRPAGLCLISTPNVQYLPHLRSLALGRFPRTSGDPEGYDGGHIHYFTYRNLEYEMERVGLKSLKRHGFGGGTAPRFSGLARIILPADRYLEYYSAGILVEGLK